MKQIDEQSLNNIYKNAHIGLQSISDLLPEAPQEPIRKELQTEYEGYEKFIGEISSYMADISFTPKDVNPMKKAMLFASVKMSAMADDSRSHLAEMMLKGTLNGIIELKTMISRGKDNVSPEILEFAKKLCEIEEGYEKNLKELL